MKFATYRLKDKKAAIGFTYEDKIVDMKLATLFRLKDKKAAIGFTYEDKFVDMKLATVTG